MIRRILYEILVAYVRLGLKVYFSRITIHGTEHIPRNGPLLFTANHQNSFLDAILIAAAQPRRLHFLVRADVFRKPLASKILRALSMMPVYRFRDGWQSLGKNAESFEEVASLFKRNEAVLIFPEGNHSLLRRLRPLSRGFTKPLALAIEKNPQQKIMVVPTGLNFSSHMSFRSGVSVYFGRPVDVSTFLQEGELDANALREKVSEEMKKLIVHIEDLNNYPVIESCLALEGFDFLDPQITNARILQASESNRDNFSGSPVKNKMISATIFRSLHFPVLAGWNRVQAKITDPVFTASLKFVYGIFAFPLYYLSIFVVVNLMAGMQTAILTLIVFAGSIFFKR
ncbi:MAG: 1-acyl-sn-glycerol-3-phosphate acyltransferase [Cyclobacteriaceae bacterium]